MRLIEVLDLFPEEINDIIDGIGYDAGGGGNSYELKFAVEDPEEFQHWQYLTIVLFQEGNTALYVRGDDIDNEKEPYIWDKTIDVYTKVRECWKNVWNLEGCD